MKTKFTKQFAEEMEAINKGWPEHLVNVTGSGSYTVTGHSAINLKEVWVSKYFRCLVYRHSDGSERLNIHRTTVDVEDGGWRGGITWDELMEVKRQVGRGDALFVEVFPKDKEIINNGNIRHLWQILNPEGLPYAWATAKQEAFSILDAPLWHRSA